MLTKNIPEKSLIERHLWTVAAGLLSLIYVIFIYRGFIFGEDTYLDPGDGVLIASIHESFYQSLLRLENIFYTPFVYPYEHSYGLTDTFLITSILYSLFRLVGFGIDSSYHLTFFSLSLTGYVLTFYFFRKHTTIKLGLSILLTTVIVFNLAVIQSSVHVQLNMAKIAVPLVLFIVLWFETRQFRKFGMGIFALGMVFFSTIYVGWYGLVFLGLYLAISTLFVRKSTQDYHQYLIYGLLGMAIPALLVAVVYLPNYIETSGGNSGAYAYYTVSLLTLFETRVPHIADLLVPSYQHVISEYGERSYGMSFILILLAITYTGMIGLSKAPKKEWHYSLVALLAVFAMIGMIYIWAGGAPLWKYVTYIVPVADNLRAYGRAPVLLLPLLLCILAVLIDRLSSTNVISNRVVIASFCLILLSSVTWDKVLSARNNATPDYILQRYSADPPSSCEFFSYINPSNDHHIGIGSDETAMIVAVHHGVPTIDGRLGQMPPGWDMRIQKRMDNDFLVRARQWIEQNELDARGYCLLMEDGQWVHATLPPLPTIRRTVISPEQFRNLQVQLVRTKATAFGSHEVVLEILNQGDEPIYPRHEGKEHVKLSYSHDGGKTYTNRFPIFKDIPANGGIKVRFTVPRNVEEIKVALVQERVFWSYDIGMEPLTIRLGL